MPGPASFARPVSPGQGLPCSSFSLFISTLPRDRELNSRLCPQQRQDPMGVRQRRSALDRLRCRRLRRDDLVPLWLLHLRLFEPLRRFHRRSPGRSGLPGTSLLPRSGARSTPMWPWRCMAAATRRGTKLTLCPVRVYRFTCSSLSGATRSGSNTTKT